MNKEQKDLLDEAYKNYEKEIIRQRQIQKEEVDRLRSQGKLLKVALIKLLSQEEFINKCKTDTEFSERWGLQIKEQELSLLERVQIYGVDKIQTNDAGYYEHSYAQFKVDEAKIPTKLITITYNKTIESYE